MIGPVVGGPAADAATASCDGIVIGPVIGGAVGGRTADPDGTIGVVALAVGIAGEDVGGVVQAGTCGGVVTIDEATIRDPVLGAYGSIGNIAPDGPACALLDDPVPATGGGAIGVVGGTVV